MSCEKFIVECQRNLQLVISAVGSKTEDNRELEQLLKELLKLCEDDPYFDLLNKAILFARNGKFTNAALCYRVFLQEHKLRDLKTIDIYLKCMFLADNANNISYGHEIIFQPIESLVGTHIQNKDGLSYLLEKNYNPNQLNLYKISQKMSFGDYANSSLEEMLERNPSYLLWCVVNVNGFVLDNRIMTDRRLLQNSLYAKAVGINLIKNKVIGQWNFDLEDEEESDMNHYRNYNWEKETFDALTDGQMGDWDDYSGDIDDVKTSMGID
ncbi:hypothetical protein GCM10028824_20160 [Hymenobacter segetis]